MKENPEAANQPGIMALIDLDIPEEEKLKRIKRKMDQMRKSFLRTPPAVN
jgi:hypothetical protein